MLIVPAPPKYFRAQQKGVSTIDWRVGYWGIGSIGVVLEVAAATVEGQLRLALSSIGIACGLSALGVLIVSKRGKRRFGNVGRAGVTAGSNPQAGSSTIRADGVDRPGAKPQVRSTAIRADGVDGLYMSDNVIEGFDQAFDVTNSRNVHGWRNRIRRKKA